MQYELQTSKANTTVISYPFHLSVNAVFQPGHSADVLSQGLNPKPCCVKVLPVSESDWQWHWQAEINTQPRPLCPSNGNQFSSLCPWWIEVYSLPVHLNFLNMANHYSLHRSHAQLIGMAVYFGPKPILQNKIHGHWDFAILYPSTLWFYDWHNKEKNINNSRHGNVNDSVLKCYHLCNLNALPLMILMCNILNLKCFKYGISHNWLNY